MFFKLIMTKSNFKNNYDVISVTSSPLRQRKTSPKLRQIFSNLGPSQSKFLATPVVGTDHGLALLIFLLRDRVSEFSFRLGKILHSFTKLPTAARLAIALRALVQVCKKR